MCQYEETTFRCGHRLRRLTKYCHFARNDPNHQCFVRCSIHHGTPAASDVANCLQGAWSIARRTTYDRDPCQNCIARARLAQYRSTTYSGGSTAGRGSGTASSDISGSGHVATRRRL
ncbi:hypothetical protein FH972_025026 [Carpinus fangiana]|uniref:Uncharacterized protein n=1 Tax=Carpinus fangiana TaxID=176857 RepID=A0A5N6L027_9ROSI|nr:hypothetical protein FH972_025026 [Carpinus fangiana]